MSQDYINATVIPFAEDPTSAKKDIPEEIVNQRYILSAAALIFYGRLIIGKIIRVFIKGAPIELRDVLILISSGSYMTLCRLTLQGEHLERALEIAAKKKAASEAGHSKKGKEGGLKRMMRRILAELGESANFDEILEALGDESLMKMLSADKPPINFCSPKLYRDRELYEFMLNGREKTVGFKHLRDTYNKIITN